MYYEIGHVIEPCCMHRMFIKSVLGQKTLYEIKSAENLLHLDLLNIFVFHQKSLISEQFFTKIRLSSHVRFHNTKALF